MQLHTLHTTLITEEYSRDRKPYINPYSQTNHSKNNHCRLMRIHMQGRASVSSGSSLTCSGSRADYRNARSARSYSVQLLTVFCRLSSFPMHGTCLPNVVFWKCLINCHSSYVFHSLCCMSFSLKDKDCALKLYNLSLSSCCPQSQRAQELDRRQETQIYVPHGMCLCCLHARFLRQTYQLRRT